MIAADATPGALGEPVKLAAGRPIARNAMLQVASLAGAVMVLIAYGGSQYAGLSADGVAYGLLNLVGSVLLAASAVSPPNAGVLLLETAWALISLGATVRALRRRGRPDGGGMS